MRAVVFDHPGDPSVLRVDDVDDPRPPTGDRILVRVVASSINGTDLGLRRGAPGSAVFGRRVRLGFDLVGEVVAGGPAVTAFAPGDRVAVFDTPGSLDATAVRRVLAPRGVLVTTRVASARTARAVVRSAVSGPRFAFVATAARSQDLARLLDLVRRGRLRVPVDRVFPLERVAEAHRYAEGGEVRGKVVVTVADGVRN